eukprot:gene11542-12735_t
MLIHFDGSYTLSYQRRIKKLHRETFRQAASQQRGNKFISDTDNINTQPVFHAEEIVSIDRHDDDESDREIVIDNDQVPESQNNVDQNPDVPVINEEQNNEQELLQSDGDVIPVCSTYEETFMNQVHSLPEKRPSALRPSVNEHCRLAESLTSE